MKPALIAVCVVTPAAGWMFAQEQAACASPSHRHRRRHRRVQRRQADWLCRNAAGSAGRGASERCLRKWCRRGGSLFQRAVGREFYPSRSADRLQWAGHECCLPRTASRAVQAHRQHDGMHPERTSISRLKRSRWGTSKPWERSSTRSIASAVMIRSPPRSGFPTWTICR